MSILYMVMWRFSGKYCVMTDLLPKACIWHEGKPRGAAARSLLIILMMRFQKDFTLLKPDRCVRQNRLYHIVMKIPIAKKTRWFRIKTIVLIWCGQQDSNLHALAVEPKSTESTNSTMPAYL